jgi:hypothetical protein
VQYSGSSETVLLDVSKEAQDRGFEISKSLAQGLDCANIDLLRPVESSRGRWQEAAIVAPLIGV